MVWVAGAGDSRELRMAVSANNGATWSATRGLTDDTSSDQSPSLVQASDGRLWLAWVSRRSGSEEIWCMQSADGGAIWSAPEQVTNDGSTKFGVAIAQASSSAFWLLWSRGYEHELWYCTRSGSAGSWGAAAHLGGTLTGTWPDLRVNSTGTLWLTYVDYVGLGGEICYRTSTNQGATWSARTRLSRFVGDDDQPSAAALPSGGMGMVWSSDRRDGHWDIWYASPGQREDTSPPPYVLFLEIQPSPAPIESQAVTFRCAALDEHGAVRVDLVWSLDGVPQTAVRMYDDGYHADYGAGDAYYGVQISPLPARARLSFTARAIDSDNNTYTYPYPYSCEVLPVFAKTSDVLLVTDEDAGTVIGHYTSTLEALNYGYDLWDMAPRGRPTASTLLLYKQGIVIWVAVDPEFDWLEEEIPSLLQTYLLAGGRLLLAGQDVAQVLGQDNYSPFMRDYLRAAFVDTDSEESGLSGLPLDPIGDGLALSLTLAEAQPDGYRAPDVIAPLTGTGAILTYGAPGQLPLRVAGVRRDAGAYKVVFLAFDVHAVDQPNRASPSRQALMGRVLAWLRGLPPPDLPTPTPTLTRSPTVTPSVSRTSTLAPTPTQTRTPARSPSPSATIAASVTASASLTARPSPTPSASSTVRPILVALPLVLRR